MFVLGTGKKNIYLRSIFLNRILDLTSFILLTAFLSISLQRMIREYVESIYENLGILFNSKHFLQILQDLQFTYVIFLL